MTVTNPLKIRRIHHVELWVGNAKQSAFFYRNGLGFSQFAYAGLETGSRSVTSYALQTGQGADSYSVHHSNRTASSPNTYGDTAMQFATSPFT